MDRGAIEELWTFTDYSWREYERAIRPWRRNPDGSGARVRLARTARCVGAYQLGACALARRPGPDYG